MSNRNKFVVILIIALVAVGVWYFIKSYSNQQVDLDTASVLPTVSVGYLPIADCAQLFVALDQGLFQAEGIQVEATLFSSGVKILQALTTENLDIGFSAVVPLILTNARGFPIVAITGGPAEDANHAEHGILVRDDGSVTSPKDLEGKTIAILAFRSIDEVFVKEWLDMNDVDVDKVSFLEMPFPQMETVLLSGQVDAIAAIEPFVTTTLASGQARLLANNYIEVQPVTEIASYNVRADWLEENPTLAGKFTRAITRATEFANQHPSELRRILAEYTNLSPELLEQVTLPFYTASLSEERLNDVMHLMHKWDIIESEFDPSTLID